MTISIKRSRLYLYIELELEPRAKFQAKNELPQFRDCLFRWSSTRLYTLEYNPEGIFVKSGGGPMYLISQRSGVVSVYVHWNMMGEGIYRST